MKSEPTRANIDRTIEAYTSARSRTRTDRNLQAIVGFIKRNKIVDRDPDEIDAILSSAEKLSGGEFIGEGDKFKRWCERMGREVPSDNLVELMNRDPYEGGQHVKRNIPNNPNIWRSWASYRAGRGRYRV